MEFFNQLIKDSKYWIRFELGLDELKGKEFFKEMQDRAISIFNFLFNKNDTILLFATISNHIDYKGRDLPRIFRFIKNNKLKYGLKCKTIPYEYDESDTEFKTVQYCFEVKKEDIRLGYLIQAIGNKDFQKKPRINGNIYLVNITKQILFHMYDDRGCDIYSPEKGTLLPLYQRFRKWILDYNRIQIDRLFEKGLFNTYETTNEMENRLKLNEIKVKETEINLFEVNTCHITHEIEVPKDSVEKCLNEITETGFKIKVEINKNDKYITVKASKTEALALIDYQSELISLYSKKYNGKYNGWTVIRAF